jgi:hypothetical protein
MIPTMNFMVFSGTRVSGAWTNDIERGTQPTLGDILHLIGLPCGNEGMTISRSRRHSNEWGRYYKLASFPIALVMGHGTAAE